MDWIKRNLYFLIGSAAALALLIAAGLFLYSKWQLNNEIMEKLNADYAELDRLNKQKPHPGSGQVNNIALAREQTQQVRAFVQKARKYFETVPAIPPGTNLTDRDFSIALSQTIDQMQREATNSSVFLPPNYTFSFAAQKLKVSFAAHSLEPLAEQLGEVRAVCQVLFKAKINSLDNLRRVRVSSDDSSGPLTDYLSEKPVTNELAVLAPYELTFRCFSSELAAVLAGYSSSPYGLLVKYFNVEPASAMAAPELTPGGMPYAYPPPQAYTPPPQATYTPPPAHMPGPDAEMRAAAAASAAAFRNRYGIGGPGGMGGVMPGGVPLRGAGMETSLPTAPPPGQVYRPNPAYPRPGALETVVDEKQLKVTMMLDVIKLLPPKKEK